MKKELEDFYKREWRDADYILSLNKKDLLWQIWKERSNKVIYFGMGCIITLCAAIIFKMF